MQNSEYPWNTCTITCEVLAGKATIHSFAPVLSKQNHVDVHIKLVFISSLFFPFKCLMMSAEWLMKEVNTNNLPTKPYLQGCTYTSLDFQMVANQSTAIIIREKCYNNYQYQVPVQHHEVSYLTATVQLSIRNLVSNLLLIVPLLKTNITWYKKLKNN